MKRKSIYKSGSVEEVRLAELLPMLMTGCIVALDVAKTTFVVALATMAGEVVNLLRFGHPVGRPDVLSRGRRASQLLMSTSLRMNL